MAEKKPDKAYPSQFDKVKEITDKLEAGIQALFESEAFKNYLKTLSKFHDYSLNNTILIAMQKPDATLVAGYTAWQKNFGRQVQKGETGIRILAPTPYKKKMEVDRLDPDTGQAILNPDGSTAKEYIYREDRAMAAAGFANNKLFHRSLIKDIRFPEKKLWYEDAEFTAIAIHRAAAIAHIPETLYHYRRGLPSTMNNNNARKNLDLLEVMLHLEDELLPDDRDDFEFLILNHILLDGMNRVQAMTSEDKKDVLWMLRQYVREKIPNLNASSSFRKETRNRRIIMRLHYLGLSGLAEQILSEN